MTSPAWPRVLHGRFTPIRWLLLAYLVVVGCAAALKQDCVRPSAEGWARLAPWPDRHAFVAQCYSELVPAADAPMGTLLAPPGAHTMYAAARALGGPAHGGGIAWFLLATAAVGAWAVVLVLLARAVPGHPWIAVPALVVPVAPVHLLADLTAVGVAAGTGAVLAAVRGRPVIGGFAAGGAVLCGWQGLVVAAVLLSHAWWGHQRERDREYDRGRDRASDREARSGRGRRSGTTEAAALTGTTVAVALAGLLPWLVLGEQEGTASGVLRWIRQVSTGALSGDSSTGALAALVAPGARQRAQVGIPGTSPETGGAVTVGIVVTALSAVAVGIAVVLLLRLVSWPQERRDEDVEPHAGRGVRVATAVCVALLLGEILGPGWTPQEALWILPFAAWSLGGLGRGKPVTVLFWWGVAEALTWPVRMGVFLGLDHKGLPTEWWTLAIVVRLLAALVLLGAVLGVRPREIFSRPTTEH